MGKISIKKGGGKKYSLGPVSGKNMASIYENCKGKRIKIVYFSMLREILKKNIDGLSPSKLDPPRGGLFSWTKIFSHLSTSKSRRLIFGLL